MKSLLGLIMLSLSGQQELIRGVSKLVKEDTPLKIAKVFRIPEKMDAIVDAENKIEVKEQLRNARST